MAFLGFGLILSACGDGGNVTEPDPLPDEFMTAQISGASFSTGDLNISTVANDFRMIRGRILEEDQSLLIDLEELTPGVYEVVDEPDITPVGVDFAFLELTESGTDIWDTEFGGGSGSLTVDAADDRSVQGRFSFTAPADDGGEPIVVTDGPFLVHLN